MVVERLRTSTRTVRQPDITRSARHAAPVGIADVELTRPLPTLSTGRHERHQVLVRLHTEPLGVVDIEDTHAHAAELAERIWAQLSAAITARVDAEGTTVPITLDSHGLVLDSRRSPYLRRRAEILANAPPVSVVLCTRDGTGRLHGCLARLAEQQYPRFETVVVDNAPATSAVRPVVASWRDRVNCRYIAESNPGLSWARNAGFRAATGELVAFIDDDETPDPHWLAELVRAFTDYTGVGCVSGAILPAALDTRAQEWFEQFGGHSKGRGFTPALFGRYGEQSPLYPLPPFGAGGNMAFTRGALEDLGGFDVALGSGTPARGAEDTLAFTRALLAGYAMVYQPSAFVRHRHHEDVTGLRQQLHGYGTGLTAYYAALLRQDPRLLIPLLRLAPHALRELLGRGSPRTAAMRDFPAALARTELAGMLVGPLAYMRSVRMQARVTSVAEARQ